MDPSLDQVRLNFSPETLRLLNAVIGLMMFGMAIDMRLEDFRRVLRSPRGPLIGLGAQFVLLPALTFGLTMAISAEPSIALGMMLVAACPGGNLSNVITYLAKGNPALSVSMTAVSSVAAIVMTPLNISLWGGLHPDTAPTLRAVHLSPADVLGTVVLILGLPLAAGLTVGRLFPRAAQRVRTPFKVFSVLVFVAVVALALRANWAYFVEYVGVVILAVVLHNALALSTGYGAAALFGLEPRDRRAVCIEVGIQNSALGLILIFDFFDGLGGMAIIAGLWGIWHIVSGLSLAVVFNGLAARRARLEAATA